MENLERAAVITSLIDRLAKEGSWCGETHIQKTMYFFQELLKVPMGFRFILYRYGPYSFTLRDELTACRAYLFLEWKKKVKYGPSFVTTKIGKKLQGDYPDEISRHERELNFVAEKLGNKDFMELERLATALYVTLDDESNQSARMRAARLRQLKKHVSVTHANEAVAEVDQFRSEWAELQSANARV